MPLGLLLSGGIDSNIIRHLSTKIKYYFCGGFEGDSDIIFCKKLKKENKLKIDICEISTPQFIRKFKGLIKLRSEPLSVPNEVMLSIIGSRAKKKKLRYYYLVKVLMNFLQGTIEFTDGQNIQIAFLWKNFVNITVITE